MAAFDCHLCQVSVPKHLSDGLFGAKEVKENISPLVYLAPKKQRGDFLRISDPLDVPVGVNNSLFEYVSEKCQ